MPTDCHCPGAFEGIHSYSCGYNRNRDTLPERSPVRIEAEEHNVEWHAKELLASLDGWNNIATDHGVDTPRRFVKALKEMTTREHFNFTTFPTSSQDMVTLGPIPFYTLCAHHVVPFYGRAWVSYVPDSKLAGLSKFARAVKWAAKGLWVQEELTAFLADFLEEKLDPLGVGVVMEAEHMCMAMRGVQQPDVVTTTAAMRGVYSDHSRTAKAEFMEVIRRASKNA